MVFTYVVHGSDIVTNNLLVGLAKRCHFLIKDRSTEIHDSLFYDDWRVTITEHRAFFAKTSSNVRKEAFV